MKEAMKTKNIPKPGVSTTNWGTSVGGSKSKTNPAGGMKLPVTVAMTGKSGVSGGGGNKDRY